MATPRVHKVTCACGKVELRLVGEPIIQLACHCLDCHEGSRRIESRPRSAKLLDAFGGTSFALYRRDRFSLEKGGEHTARLKVDDDSPDRVYSTCCNSALFMDLDQKMHWVPVYLRQVDSVPPSIEMRINAKSTQADDVPTYASLAPKFIWRLVAARISMMLRLAFKADEL